jgi:hypothetical protein
MNSQASTSALPLVLAGAQRQHSFPLEPPGSAHSAQLDVRIFDGLEHVHVRAHELKDNLKFIHVQRLTRGQLEAGEARWELSPAMEGLAA